MYLDILQLLSAITMREDDIFGHRPDIYNHDTLQDSVSVFGYVVQETISYVF